MISFYAHRHHIFGSFLLFDLLPLQCVSGLLLASDGDKENC